MDVCCVYGGEGVVERRLCAEADCGMEGVRGVVCVFFFFQPEAGNRVWPNFGGLGDVYRGQH